jgi:hypothetical protein
MLGLGHHEVHMCTAMIKRNPKPWTAKSFGLVEWWPRSSVGELIDLLPRGSRTIDATEFAMLDKWFGTHGKFPAVHHCCPVYFRVDSPNRSIFLGFSSKIGGVDLNWREHFPEPFRRGAHERRQNPVRPADGFRSLEHLRSVGRPL